MRSAESIKKELLELQDSYVPQGETARHISKVSIGEIIGVTCVGKSTVIRAVVELDSSFSNPGGFTSRQIRGYDSKTYRHLDDSAESLSDFLDRIHRGEPVQYNIYNTGDIYGSEAKDYPTPYSVLDTHYSAVANIDRAGFKSTHPIALVTQPDQYEEQLKERFHDKWDSDDFKIRLDEAEKSLVWCLEQGQKISWVINRHGKQDSAAREVIGLIKGVYPPLRSANSIGEKLLKRVRLIKDSL